MQSKGTLQLQIQVDLTPHSVHDEEFTKIINSKLITSQNYLAHGSSMLLLWCMWM